MSSQMQPQSQWEKKSRSLIHLLIWSGALNIGLFSSLLYFVFKDRPETIHFDKNPAVVPVSKSFSLTNEEMLTNLSTLSWNELVAEMKSLELVEEGYTRRDLALACLVAFHGFDIERALQGQTPQKREIRFKRKEGPEEIQLILYPGLKHEQFEAICHFIQTEKYPLTTQGLFYELKTASSPRDPALLSTFYLSEEFQSLETICQRNGVHLPRHYLVEMTVQGDWHTLQQFSEEQKQSHDVSNEKFRKILLKYVKCRSVLAAKVLLQWDREFVVKRLDDAELITLLDVFQENSHTLDLVLKELITSSRSDAVWKKAAERLYLFAQLPFPEPYDHKCVLSTFAPSTTVGGQVQASKDKANLRETGSSQRSIKHIVQKGDNLWKIARKYKVSIEVIKKENQLESEKLLEGKVLKIPSSTKANN